ncbi:MAG: nitroreductase family protein [Clostridia bacterium]|nr:nitroreductase family protein [Clostridia bacterium]MBP5458596.1 nitroreductase family protein [Clostridia bacterium]
MRKAIEERYSVRTFDKTPLRADDVAFITERVAAVNKATGMNWAFLEDGSAAFSGFRSSYGMFRGVRSLIVLKSDPSVPDYREKSGYYAEELVLDLVERGLGTCWVGGTFDHDALSIPDGETFVCLVLVGYPGKIALKDRVLLARLHEQYKPISERLTATGYVPQDIMDGMESVRLAPSAVNSQTPHFTYDDGILTAAIPEDATFGFVDLGIAKCHFVQEAGGSFEFGNHGRWTK